MISFIKSMYIAMAVVAATNVSAIRISMTPTTRLREGDQTWMNGAPKQNYNQTGRLSNSAASSTSGSSFHRHEFGDQTWMHGEPKVKRAEHSARSDTNSNTARSVFSTASSGVLSTARDFGNQTHIDCQPKGNKIRPQGNVSKIPEFDKTHRNRDDGRGLISNGQRVERGGKFPHLDVAHKNMKPVFRKSTDRSTFRQAASGMGL